MFTVYDSKSEAYLPPIFHRSRGEALRAFEATANTPDHQFNKYAGDFTFFELGEYNDSTGEITQLPAKINLGTALEFIEIQPVNHLTQETMQSILDETHNKPHHES